MPPQITLYSEKDFQGRQAVLTDACRNMLDKGFDQTAVSVKVQEGVWVLFQETNFGGKIWVVMKGEEIKYLTYFNKMARSIKPLDTTVHDFYAEQEIKISTDTGHTVTLHNDVSDLSVYDLLRKVSKVNVSKGGWIGYDGRGYKGKQALFLTGEYEEDTAHNSPFNGFFASNGGISALRKIQIFPTGELRLCEPIHYHLDKAKLTTTPLSVFQWTQTNNTLVQQNLSRSEMHEISKQNTYEFRWESISKMAAHLQVTAGIPMIGVGSTLDISVEKTVHIGSSEGISVSETNKWIAEYPTAIPAESTITLTSTLTEGNFNVPFTAVFTQGDDPAFKVMHHGTFIGVQFYGFETKFEQKGHPTQVLLQEKGHMKSDDRLLLQIRNERM